MKTLLFTLILINLSPLWADSYRGPIKKFSGRMVESNETYSYYALAANRLRIAVPNYLNAEKLAESNAIVTIDGEFEPMMCTDMSAACMSGMFDKITAISISFAQSNNEETQSNFIGVGPLGQSGKFKNKLTVFIDVDDPQPKCPGCVVFRVIYDFKDDDLLSMAGMPWTTEVGVNVKKACGEFAEISHPTRLNPIGPQPTAAVQSKLFAHVNPSMCHGDTITVEFFAQRCMNPTEPTCQDLVLTDSFDLDFKQLIRLNPLDSSAQMPNQSPNQMQ